MSADLGSDLSGVADLDPSGAMVSGRSCLSQAIARRLTTPRGRLIDDANYGLDLRAFLNDDLSPADLGRIKALAEAECLKDERVRAATVTFTLPASGVAVVTLVIQDGTGPFNLVLSVNAVTVTVLTVI